VMMTAEKAADLILGNTPLPPEPVEFFRRDRDRVRTGEHQVRSDD
jgi:choline dehydrogenase